MSSRRSWRIAEAPDLLGRGLPGQQAERREAPERQDDRQQRLAKAVLAEVAWANARRKTGYFGAQFRRLARRRGLYKALIAGAHRILVIIYHILRERRPYCSVRNGVRGRGA